MPGVVVEGEEEEGTTVTDLLGAVDRTEESVVTTDFEVDGVEGARVGACTLVVETGAGSKMASTQYEFPTTMFPHSAVIEGFYALY